jgi:hypothetical protein
MSEEENKQKPRPTNDIDLQMQTLEPHISSPYMSEELKNLFRVKGYYKDEFGNIQEYIIKDYWAWINTHTQDDRLGNVDKTRIRFCEFNNALGRDILNCLPAEFSKNAFICLDEKTFAVEISQSFLGFNKKNMQSFFQHQSIKQTEENKNKGWFNFFNKKEKEFY